MPLLGILPNHSASECHVIWETLLWQSPWPPHPQSHPGSWKCWPLYFLQCKWLHWLPLGTGMPLTAGPSLRLHQRTSPLSICNPDGADLLGPVGAACKHEWDRTWTSNNHSLCIWPGSPSCQQKGTTDGLDHPGSSPCWSPPLTNSLGLCFGKEQSTMTLQSVESFFWHSVQRGNRSNNVKWGTLDWANHWSSLNLFFFRKWSMWSGISVAPLGLWQTRDR